MTSENFRENARPHASELLGRSWLNTGGVDLSLEDLRGKIVVSIFGRFAA